MNIHPQFHVLRCQTLVLKFQVPVVFSSIFKLTGEILSPTKQDLFHPLVQLILSNPPGTSFLLQGGLPSKYVLAEGPCFRGGNLFQNDLTPASIWIPCFMLGEPQEQKHWQKVPVVEGKKRISPMIGSHFFSDRYFFDSTKEVETPEFLLPKSAPVKCSKPTRF